MKIKWTDVMKLAHSAGFTDEEYGLVCDENKLDRTIGVEEYAIGVRLYKLFFSLGLEIEVDIETPFKR
jgi:hypothetical protein